MTAIDTNLRLCNHQNRYKSDWKCATDEKETKNNGKSNPRRIGHDPQLSLALSGAIVVLLVIV